MKIKIRFSSNTKIINQNRIFTMKQDYCFRQIKHVSLHKTNQNEIVTMKVNYCFRQIKHVSVRKIKQKESELFEKNQNQNEIFFEQIMILV